MSTPSWRHSNIDELKHARRDQVSDQNLDEVERRYSASGNDAPARKLRGMSSYEEVIT